MHRLFCRLLFCSLLGLSGCGPATINQAVKDEQSPLDSRQIFDIVSGNSLIMLAPNFSGTVYFDENGLLSAVDNQDQRDIGTWDVNDQDQLCMKFKLWYYGDTKCYRVFNDEQEEKLSFFTTNGAAYYTAVSVAGDPASLASRLGTSSSPRSVRKQYSDSDSSGRTSPSSQQAASADRSEITVSPSTSDDTEKTVKRLAGDCPGCKLAGLDLRETSLIKANLQDADLSGADLRYANLRRANLKGANLEGANLTHANLPGADLTGANLRNCDLTGANLLLANFTDADTAGANFTNANLERIIGLNRQQ
ncbi:MAG: pentapeptide repeat-containing protein [Desulfofustis sp.]|nr:pentapeptide repeat-containing protein [Desulfofustis sp.]